MEKKIKGRGAVSNPDCRFQSQSRHSVDEGYFDQDIELYSENQQTHITRDASKTIISKNTSPDVPFTQSLNPYRGCEHGCIYCFARPTHAYLDLSPGLDFETKLIIKPDAAKLLSKALNKKNYPCQTLALGSNTDPYQPIEREYKITRNILQVLADYQHPVSIITKSALIERDIDILTELAQSNLVEVMISICTLDKALARSMEPRASSPARRLKTIEQLAHANIPVGVLVAPTIPVLNDPELENILQASSARGASRAGNILLRLPLEVAPLFEEWLNAHYPLKAAHVMTRIRDTRGGDIYNSEYGTRMQGEGAFAAIIRQRFDRACKKLGIESGHRPLNKTIFRIPEHLTPQMSLF